MKVHYIRNSHTPLQCLVQRVSKINYTGGEGEESKGVRVGKEEEREGGRERRRKKEKEGRERRRKGEKEEEREGREGEKEEGRKGGRERRRKGMERKNRRVIVASSQTTPKFYLVAVEIFLCCDIKSGSGLGTRLG